MNASIVLLGDSIFDNAAYVIDEPCVTEQLRAIVPKGSEVSMLAVDGDCVPDVAGQLYRVPDRATHLLVSAGGNDALGYYNMLTDTFRTSVALFDRWSAIQQDFRDEYRKMVDTVTSLERHTVVCTIYDAVPGLEDIAVTALSLFNDVIISEAIRGGVPVIELRQICTEPGDYSHLSPIEPSARGGEKIAVALNRVLEEHDFSKRRTAIYGA